MKKQADTENLIIVDGHNFIFNFFKAGKLSIEKIEYLKEKLIADLIWYKNQKNCDIMVVFDARNSNNLERESRIVDGVRVIHSRRNESADDIIEELAGMETGYRRIFVVTSDYLQQKVVFRKNVYRKSSREFNLELRDFKRKTREDISDSRKDSNRQFRSLEKRLSSGARKKLSELRKK